MEPTERAIVKAALGGDPEAFEMLIKQHGRMLYAQAYSILRQPEEAEDVVQESLIKAYQSRWRVRDPEKFPQWLVTITRNRALDLLKKRRTVPLSETEYEAPDNPNQKPDRQAEGGEMRDKIHKVLALLPESHRTAITLRYLEGMDCRSIEKIMNLSNGALRGILGRALQTLRTSLHSLTNLSPR